MKKVLPGFLWVIVPIPALYVMYTSNYNKESGAFNFIRVKKLHTLDKRFQHSVIIIPQPYGVKRAFLPIKNPEEPTRISTMRICPCT